LWTVQDSKLLRDRFRAKRMNISTTGTDPVRVESFPQTLRKSALRQIFSLWKAQRCFERDFEREEPRA